MKAEVGQGVSTAVWEAIHELHASTAGHREDLGAVNIGWQTLGG